MASKVAAIALHATAAAVMAWAYHGLETTVLDSYIRSQRGGHSQFLTIQSLAISWLTMVLSLSADLVPSSILIKRAKRALFMIALPLSVVVTVIYWSLILLMPSLIVQTNPADSSSPPSSSSDAPSLAYIPLDLDLGLHASPALALLLDFFCFERTYGAYEARRGATAMAVAFGVWYSIWVEYCAVFNDTFPYPFLTHNQLPGRIAIYCVVTTIAFLSFRGINTLHGRITSPASPNKKAA